VHFSPSAYKPTLQRATDALRSGLGAATVTSRTAPARALGFRCLGPRVAGRGYLGSAPRPGTPSEPRHRARAYAEYLGGQSSLVPRLCESRVTAWVVFGGPKDTGLKEQERQELDSCPTIMLIDWSDAGTQHAWTDNSSGGPDPQGRQRSMIAATRQVPVRRRHARPKPVDQLRILERLASPPDPKPAASSRTLARIKTSKPATIVGS